MKRLLVLAVSVGVLGAVPAAVAQAQTSQAKIPPVCVQKTVAKLHFQVGYCP